MNNNVLNDVNVSPVQEQQQAQQQQQQQQQGQQQQLNIGEGALSPVATATVRDSGNSSATATGGNVTLETGAITGGPTTATATNGDQTTTIGDIKPTQNVSITQTYKQLPGVAGVATPETPYTQLYDLSAITAEKGIDLSLAYDEICDPYSSSSAALQPSDEVMDDVQMFFVPHPSFRDGSGNNTVYAGLPKDGINAACVGVLTAESVSKKKNLPYSVVETRAMQYANEHFGRYSKVYLVTLRDVVAANRGVVNRGGAWNLLPGISSILGGDSVGSAGGGLARNHGQAFTGVRVGTTYLVFAEDPASDLRITLKSLEPQQPEQPAPPPTVPESTPTEPAAPPPCDCKPPEKINTGFQLKIEKVTP